MKTEISAGGVIVTGRRAAWRVLLMRDMSGAWTFPKGKLEEGEKPEAAALREIEEEVGIRGLTLIAPLKKVSYYYRRSGLVRKYVHYYLFQSERAHKPTVQKEEGITAAKWTALTLALRDIGYPKTNKQLLIKTKRLLQ